MLSIPHLIIIFVVALVVFGPEKLPELARNLGKVMAEFKRATGDLRSTFEGHLKDLEREADHRRIGASMAATPSAAPAPEPAIGTVPTLPPHIGTASEGNPEVPAEATREVSTHQTHPQPQPPAHSEETEPNPETVSDGGTRPA